MNDQERTLLNNLLNNLISTSTGQKDPEADKLIHEAVNNQPDAAYLLVQRTLLQKADPALTDWSNDPGFDDGNNFYQ